jgi:predicted RNase H-like HicB family nuclease
MKYPVRLQVSREGGFIAVSTSFPNCWSKGGSREEALNRIREEIRYRIELCPCTGVSDDFVEVVIMT